MNTFDVAAKIKQHLVDLAVNDEFPLDLNELDIHPIIDILNEAEGESAFGFDVGDAIEHAAQYGYTIDEEAGKQIIGRLCSKGDLGAGVSWDTLLYYIEEYCENNNIEKKEVEEDE